MSQKSLAENKANKRKKVQWSSSGRRITPNKHLLSSDSEDFPVTKKIQKNKEKSTTKEIQSLIDLVAKIEKGNISSPTLYEEENESVTQKENQPELLNIVQPDKDMTYTNDYHLDATLPVLQLPSIFPITMDEDCKTFMQEVLQKLSNLEKQNETIIEKNNLIEEQCKELRNDNIALRERLDDCISAVSDKVMTENGTKVHGLLIEPPSGFPIETLQDFENLETDQKKRLELFNHFKNVGACKLREFVSYALKHTMSDELLNNFTWLGLNGTSNLQDASITKTIYSAAVECPLFPGPNSIQEFKTEIVEVLRATKQRHRNKLARADPQGVFLNKMKALKEKYEANFDTAESNSSSVDLDVVNEENEED